MSYTPTGWLAMLRMGFLHRDVSIGNTLMLDPPVMMKRFEARTIDQHMAQLSLEYKDDLTKYTNQLEDVIKKMGFSDRCHGFLIDGDMAAELEGYLTQRDKGEVSVSICLPIVRGIPAYDFRSGDISVHVHRVGGRSNLLETISALSR